MKTIVILTAIIFLSNKTSYSQTNYVVIYDTWQIPDTAHPNIVREELMALHIFNNGSEFFSETDRMQREKMQKLLEESEVTGQTSINYGHIKKTTQDRIYIVSENISSSKRFYTLKQHKNNHYLITGETPSIQWKIENKTKRIGEHKCQLAMGILVGEQYEAWFTTDIPIPFGPWELYGLPGLILEASNTTGTRKYVFNEIKILRPNQSILLPKDAIATNQKDFDKMVKASSRSNQKHPSDARIEIKKSN